MLQQRRNRERESAAWMSSARNVQPSRSWTRLLGLLILQPAAMLTSSSADEPAVVSQLSMACAVSQVTRLASIHKLGLYRHWSLHAI